ncbi:MAG: SpoIIE family protein phosphatase [Brevinematales bacterium]|nr:SpoIIE family protein phosphatase [Brevinematales bacterium]
MLKIFSFFFFFPLVSYGLSFTGSITTITEPVFLATKGNPPGAERLDCDDSTWTRISLPTNLRSVLGEAEDYWVRWHLYIPPTSHEPLAIFMGYIYASDAFYINGKYHDGHGIFPTYENAHDTWRFYSLFSVIPGKTNILAWHIKGAFKNYTGADRAPFQIGPYLPLFWKVYKMDIVGLGFLIVYTCIWAYLMLFFLQRPSQKDYLAFSFFILALIIYSFTRTQVKFFLWRNYTLLKQIEYLTYYLLVPCFLLFIRVFFEDKRPVGRGIQYFSFSMAIPGYVLAFFADWEKANVYNFSFYQPLIFTSGVSYILFLLLRYFKKSKEAKLFLGGFVFIILAILHDIALARGFLNTRPITPFAFFGFVVFFALVLANRFVQLYHRLEDLNKNLEQKVHERTQELEESNERLLQAQKQIQFELELAQRIQQSMMPKQFDNMLPVKLHGMYMPMEELGGDFYDVYKTQNRYLHLIIADVSGHGVPSALIAMMAKAFLNYYSENDPDPASVVAAVNTDLCRQLGDVENYLTLFYGVVDMETHTLSYVNAGHVSIFYLSPSGEVHKLVAQTPFLGKFEHLCFSAQTLSLDGGGKLVLYTDGITETRNEKNTLFGEGHFMDILSFHSKKSPEELTSLILEELDHFRGSMPYGDDITLLIVEFPPETAEIKEVFPQQDVGKLYEKALMNYKNNNLEEAERLLTTLLEYHTLSPEDIYRISILAGNLASQQNKWNDAYSHWKKALDIHPENEKLRSYLVTLEKKLKKTP